MRALTEEWVNKPEKDIFTVKLVLGVQEPMTEIAAFHSQQCAEKYLKAYLQEIEIEFPFRHPLLPLLELCISVDDTFEMLRDDLRRLDGYATAVRYPGMTVSNELAESAFAAAERVRAFIRRKLGLSPDSTVW